MPLNPDDALALADFDAEMAAPKRGGMSGFIAENRLTWLRRVVGDLKARVDELEAGGVPAVIAQKDAEIAARDAQLAKHAERVRELEALKLPEPGKFYRDQLPMIAVADDVTTTTPVPDSKEVPGSVVRDRKFSDPETVATHEKTNHDQN